MWQALVGYLGANTNAAPSKEGETIFIAETNDRRRLKEAFSRAVPLGRCPGGYFRFVSFGHPPALVFSAESRKFVNTDESRMKQFLPLGLQIPRDHPDRKKYYSMKFRPRELNSSDVAEITLTSPGTFWFFTPMECTTAAIRKSANNLK
jgi:hypothetical protein